MSRNIFMEGRDISPVEISLILSEVEVTDFQYYERILKGFRYVDEISKTILSECWEFPKERLERRPIITNLRKESPFGLDFTSDPIWLVILLLILLNYKNAKENIAEIQRDIQLVVEEFTGLAEDELEWLVTAINTIVDRLSKLPNLYKALKYKLTVTRNILIPGKKPKILQIYINRNIKEKGRSNTSYS